MGSSSLFCQIGIFIKVGRSTAVTLVTQMMNACLPKRRSRELKHRNNCRGAYDALEMRTYMIDNFQDRGVVILGIPGAIN